MRQVSPPPILCLYAVSAGVSAGRFFSAGTGYFQARRRVCRESTPWKRLSSWHLYLRFCCLLNGTIRSCAAASASVSDRQRPDGRSRIGVWTDPLTVIEDPFGRASRRAAFEALQAFLPRAGSEYSSRRDFDLGPGEHDNVSGLSPYIRHRLINETEVLAAVLQQHGASGASRFVQEVFWRSYFKGWLEHHPSVWRDYRAKVSGLIDSLGANPGLRKRYESALHATTGIECFDAWVTELTTTGYLQNHARMWFASIWIYTLGLPWQLGADFFYRHLLDADPASNTLSWRWVCGLHTKGKTYLARAANISRYTRGRFDPDGLLAEEAPPLHEGKIHSTRSLPPAQSIPADARFGLLVTEDDCSPESLLPGETPHAVMGAVTTESRSPLPVGFGARRFTTGAVAEATERAARRFGIPAQSAHSDDWNDALLAWAGSNGLDTIVTAYAPVGPVAERLAMARRALASNNVELIQLRRSYDERVWPHTTRGYFKLKSRIPFLLRELELTGPDDASQRAAG
jgi:deoxyribodipyrimidine photo-lyase